MPKNPQISQFFIRTSTGPVPMPVIEVFECRGRKLIIHEGHQQKFAVSDYLTGILMAENRYKTELKRLAEKTLLESDERAIAGTFSWASYPEINGYEFIQGWNAVHELFRSRGPFLEGVKMAVESLQTQKNQ